MSGLGTVERVGGDYREEDIPITWGKVIDQTKCIGCHACTTACKSENLVPLGVDRTYVKQVEVGVYPEISRHFQVTRCNQCSDAPCVPVCPVTAMYKREDGIVDFDTDACIGCQACVVACPYDAIHISPESGSAEKCNFCAHRIDQGLEPACVVVCPEEAIIVGNLNDPESEVSTIIARQKVDVRKPEKGTSPKVFYVGANAATLSPTLASYQGAHLWSVQKEGYPVEDQPSTVKSVAAARINYEVPHKGVAWDWKVSLYTWTKSIASGIFLIFAFLGLLGYELGSSWSVAVSIVGGVFLALTGLLLIAKLSHPWRFYRIFTRPQWKSWLVRGAFIILFYALVLILLFVAGVGSMPALARALWWPGLILSGLTAIYTAFLLSSSKGRDLWQNPLLPVHMFVQAILAGAATVVLVSLLLPLPENALAVVQTTLLISALLYLALVLSEMVIPHVTADAALAAKQMIWGRYRSSYWIGLIAGGLLPVVLVSVGVIHLASLAALAGLMLYEHAYMQAGQSVPLS